MTSQPADPSNPQAPALPAPVQEWLAHLAGQRRYSPHTLSAYGRDMQKLVALAGARPLASLVTGHIRQYLGQLHAQDLGPRSLARVLAAWRGFYQWWAPREGLPSNPAAGVRAPKQPRPLPKALSVEQTQALLEQRHTAPALADSGARDSAMFELLYSSGLRLSELANLDWRYERSADHESLCWLDLSASEVHILGKGGKRRTVPVGSVAVNALQVWLEQRESWISPQAEASDRAALFLGSRGRRIVPRMIERQLEKWGQSSGLPSRVHPHVLRHSFASHVLQSAQDLRAVQEMLGHASISTTQIYTRLDFQHLAQAYDQAHPRANRRSGQVQASLPPASVASAPATPGGLTAISGDTDERAPPDDKPRDRRTAPTAAEAGKAAPPGRTTANPPRMPPRKSK